MKTVLTTLGISLLVLAGCAGQKQAESNFIQENIDNAVAQETIQTDIIEKSGKILNPRTIDKDGNIVYVPIDDWCSGFFPGNIWHMYELTGDQKWLPLAEKYTEDLDSVQYLTWHHDVGFMIGSSYLNGYRFAGKEEYKPVIIQTAKSLSTRFRPAAGVLQSWDADKGWQAERGWKCPVIIDNMMNLELLFWAARNGGGQYLYDIACKHAETTMKHQFRKDYSCYHVAVYDTLDGHFIKGVTHQGLSDDSMWARGQAWAIYGYTMVYRETHDVRFLDFARKVSDVYLSRLPEDMIPYWDFNAPELSSGEPKDASASAITASALLELSTYINDSDSAFFYRNKAVEMLQILSSPAYQARNKKDAFLLHSVGHMNKGWEVDASISYADYYYLEALVRLKRLKEKQSVLANL